jgi:hypothetical protein
LTGALAAEATKFRGFNNPRRHRIPQHKCGASSGSAPLSKPIFFDHFGVYGQGVPVQNFVILSTNALVKEISGAEDQILAGMNVDHLLLKINVCIYLGSVLSNWCLTYAVAGV